MNPTTKIILISVVFGLISACVTVGLYYVLIIGAVGSFLGGGKLLAAPLLFIGYYGSRLSFLICPLVAFYFRQTVFDSTPDLYARILVFVLMSSASLPFLGIGYGGVRFYEKWSSMRARAQADERVRLVEEIKGAGTEIVASDAVVVESAGDIAVAEMNFDVGNLSPLVSEYRLALVGGRNGDGFIYFFNDFPPGKEFQGCLFARREDNEWRFYSYPGNKLVSSDQRKVSFRLRIEGFRSSDFQRSTTITPFLTIWHDGEGVYKNYQVWRKTIPLTIRR